MALSSLVTLIVGLLWNFFSYHTKRAVEKRKEERKKILKEVM